MYQSRHADWHRIYNTQRTQLKTVSNEFVHVRVIATNNRQKPEVRKRPQCTTAFTYKPKYAYFARNHFKINLSKLQQRQTLYTNRMW